MARTPPMTLSQGSLRQSMRAASEALSRAGARLAAEVGATDNSYAQRGVGGAQLNELKQGLLQTARNHFETVTAAALQNFESVGLPGLGQRAAGDPVHALREGQFALSVTWNSLAELASLCGDKDASIAAYRNALEFAPDDVTTNAQLADLLESRHDLENAKVHAERALRGDPANLVAAIALARVLIRQGRFADAERAALAAANAPRALVDDRALAWSIVGEARDRLNNTAAAFKAFTQGNRLLQSRYQDVRELSHPAHPANVRRLVQFVEFSDAAVWRAPTTFATPAPAFLIGFPRSGTTLIEQILSSHSKITCLGETEHLFEAMSVVLGDGDLLDRLTTLTAAEIEMVRGAYRRIVLADDPEAEDHLIVDKHPLHITILPLINKFFPDSKIIFSMRDPRDVVLSCYQQCFGINVATMEFLDLERAADYYGVVMELMMACRQKLPLDLHEVEYRDVVANLEKEARNLAEFIGMSFDPAMLRYDEAARNRAIASASARQVINPIYSRSVERWRRYARELAPALPLLNKCARRLGYDD